MCYPPTTAYYSEGGANKDPRSGRGCENVMPDLIGDISVFAEMKHTHPSQNTF